MKIWHRGHISPEHKELLETYSIKFEPWYSLKDPNRIVDYVFEIDESHPFFLEIQKRLAGKSTYVATKFTPEEIPNAEWCIARANHSIQSVRSAKIAWDEEYIADFCKNCGGGWRQIAAFRIKKEPKLGKNVFADFGSAFELFCAPEVLEAFSKDGISGFQTRPLILDKEDRPAESLKQLVVTEIARPAIAADLAERERYSQTDCPVCGQTWHSHYIRGMLPLRRSALIPEVGFQLTNEWFGNGLTARREILVSQRVVRLILEKKWKGIDLIPIQAI